MLKRTPLARRTPLKSRSTLKRSLLARKRAKPRRGRHVDPAHLAFVRSLPCCVPECSSGPVQAHHETTARGKGQKQSDLRTMPLCWVHHSEFHAHRGAFKGWTLDQRRAWQAEQVEAVLKRRGG